MCVLIAVHPAAAIVPIVKDSKLDERKLASVALADIGAPASSCEDRHQEADGSQNHVPVRDLVDYIRPHRRRTGPTGTRPVSLPAPFAKKFYR